MASEQVTLKMWEGLRDRHNDLEKQVRVVGENANRAIKGVNEMLPRKQWDDNWDVLIKRIAALEKRIAALEKQP